MFMLALSRAGIARIVIFLSPALLGMFGLPQVSGPDAGHRAPDLAGPPAPDLAAASWPR